MALTSKMDSEIVGERRDAETIHLEVIAQASLARACGKSVGQELHLYLIAIVLLAHPHLFNLLIYINDTLLFSYLLD